MAEDCIIVFPIVKKFPLAEPRVLEGSMNNLSLAKRTLGKVEISSRLVR
jgi:hypothetical protein